MRGVRVDVGGRKGPLHVVIKRGEYGALSFKAEHISFVPAFPLEDVFDPTGAGDTFAGGFMGWLDRHLARGEPLEGRYRHFRTAVQSSPT